MATTPQPIHAAILTSNTTLYTAFVGGGATRAMLVFLILTNTTSADITVDVFWENAAGSTTRLIADDINVPAKGTETFRGIVSIDTSSEKIRAIASAVGVDAVGTVMENA
jgi:hypothetical protein